MLNRVFVEISPVSVVGKEIMSTLLESLSVTTNNPIIPDEIDSCFTRIIGCLNKMKMYISPESPLGKELRELIKQAEII